MIHTDFELPLQPLFIFGAELVLHILVALDGINELLLDQAGLATNHAFISLSVSRGRVYLLVVGEFAHPDRSHVWLLET